jgi:hypothetical protein
MRDEECIGCGEPSVERGYCEDCRKTCQCCDKAPATQFVMYGNYADTAIAEPVCDTCAPLFS